MKELRHLLSLYYENYMFLLNIWEVFEVYVLSY